MFCNVATSVVCVTPFTVKIACAATSGARAEVMRRDLVRLAYHTSARVRVVFDRLDHQPRDGFMPPPAFMSFINWTSCGTCSAPVILEVLELPLELL